MIWGPVPRPGSKPYQYDHLNSPFFLWKFANDPDKNRRLDLLSVGEANEEPCRTQGLNVLLCAL